MIMKIMMKRMTVHLVEELGDARKGECGNSAFDRLVSRLQLVQKAHLMVIMISVMEAPTMILVTMVTMMLNRNWCNRRT